MPYGGIPDNVSRAGHEFDYSVWTAGTRITLCNVPWDNTYRDVVGFDTQSQLDRYLDQGSGPTVTFTTSYARVGDPIAIDLPFNAVYKYNYLRVTNPAQPVVGDTPRTFYYFILDVQHAAPNTTRLIVQLDVYQSFIRYAQLGRSFIERGHIGVANSRQFEENGREFLTVPEGLDLGNEYGIKTTYVQDFHNVHKFSIVMATTVSLKVDNFGTVSQPIMESANGSWAGGLPSGMETYVFPIATDFMNFMQQMSEKPWITQGITSITAIPYIGDIVKNDPSNFQRVHFNNSNIVEMYEYAGVRTLGRVFKVAPDFRDGYIISRYRHLKKFLTYPYMAVEVTTFSGTPIILKPECIPGRDITLVAATQATPPNPRMVVFPVGYNARKGAFIHDDFDTIMRGNDEGEFLDVTTGIFNLPQFPLVNNSYLNYMASNANSIAYQHQSADWSQQRALSGNQLSYDQASAGIDLNSQLTNLGIGAANASLGVQNQAAVFHSVAGGVGSVLGGSRAGGAGMAMGAASAISNGVGTAIDMNARNQQTAISNNLSRNQTGATNSNSAFVRDTNRAYADFAAKGDYQNTIAAINAKVQDAKLIAPTVSGQIGGDAFVLSQYKWAINIRIKTLQPGIMAMIGEYWLRYGYAVNRFANIYSLKVMSKFSYWKLRETYIRSATMPEGFKATLRGIFEKGVTVWNNPVDIGVIDPSTNEPIPGVFL